MIATRNNMREAEARNPGAEIVMVDREGGTYSANPNDYFYVTDEYVFMDGDTPMLLGVVVPRDVRLL